MYRALDKSPVKRQEGNWFYNWEEKNKDFYFNMWWTQFIKYNRTPKFAIFEFNPKSIFLLGGLMEWMLYTYLKSYVSIRILIRVISDPFLPQSPRFMVAEPQCAPHALGFRDPMLKPTIRADTLGLSVGKSWRTNRWIYCHDHRNLLNVCRIKG